MFTSAIKKQTSDCCSISLNPYNGILNLESWKKRNRKAILLLAYIADVSCLTNRSFYMRTLTLSLRFNLQELFRFFKLIYIFIINKLKKSK